MKLKDLISVIDGNAFLNIINERVGIGYLWIKLSLLHLI